MQTKIIHWDDIDCTFVYNLADSYMTFQLFEVTAHSDNGDGKYSVKNYDKKGATSSHETTENISEAQTLIKGTIKWDGCSHIYFGDEEGYIHVCGGGNWRMLIKVLDRIFEFAKEKLMEDHAKDMW